jgi:hypothetical protein
MVYMRVKWKLSFSKKMIYEKVEIWKENIICEKYDKCCDNDVCEL